MLKRLSKRISLGGKKPEIEGDDDTNISNSNHSHSGDDSGRTSPLTSFGSTHGTNRHFERNLPLLSNNLNNSNHNKPSSIIANSSSGNTSPLNGSVSPPKTIFRVPTAHPDEMRTSVQSKQKKPLPVFVRRASRDNSDISINVSDDVLPESVSMHHQSDEPVSVSPPDKMSESSHRKLMRVPTAYPQDLLEGKEKKPLPIFKARSATFDNTYETEGITSELSSFTLTTVNPPSSSLSPVSLHPPTTAVSQQSTATSFGELSPCDANSKRIERIPSAHPGVMRTQGGVLPNQRRPLPVFVVKDTTVSVASIEMK